MCLSKAKKLLRRRRLLLRATRKLYQGQFPYRPYARVNRVLTDWKPKVPGILANLIPRELRQAVELRLRQRVVSKGLSVIVYEGIVITEKKDYSVALPLPFAACGHWAADGANVSRFRSLIRFSLLIFGCLGDGVSKFRSLIRNELLAPPNDYVVALNFSQGVWDSAISDKSLGFIPWLISTSPLGGTFGTLLFCNFNARGSFDRMEVLIDEVKSKCVVSPFPVLQTLRKRLTFCAISAVYFLLSLVLITIGKWQGVVLLSELIELQYFRLLSHDKRAKAYIFTLGDQLNRPLWTWCAEMMGAQSIFVFFASSYSMFHYQNCDVPADQRHPAVVGNIWSRCWVQTSQVRSSIESVLEQKPEIEVVGSFDMIDYGSSVPELKSRSILVFDAEPNGQLLRLSEQGYLCPFLTEDVVVEFWRELVEVAKELSLVLVHKPKRPNPSFREGVYAGLIEDINKEGIYQELSAGIGPMRAMASVQTSVILPFTSVGDCALQTGTRAAFFDARGTIFNPDSYANGLTVLRGRSELRKWLSDCFDGEL